MRTGHRTLFALSALVLLASAPAEAAFARRKVISLNRAQVPGGANLVDFPVLVSLTDANLRTTGNGGFVTSSQGHDILFQSEDPATCAPAAQPCRLDHEIESYNPATGALVAWVRVPNLRHSASGNDSVVTLYYGDATVTCSQQNKAGVWNSGYREVFHLNEAGDHADSTLNAFTGVTNGSYTKAVAGRVGPALDLGGGAAGLTPAYANVSDGTLPTGTSFTFEAWVNFRTINAGQFIGLVTKGREALNFDGDPDAGGGFCTVAPCGDWAGLYKLPDGSGNEVLAFEWAYGSVCKAAGLRDMRGAVANLSTATWYHVAAGFDSATSTRRLLVNGAQVATDTIGACLEAAIPHYTRLGTDSNQDYLDGQLDEVRISFAARTNGWITAGYNNQSSPAAFYSSVVDTAGPFAVTPTACPAINPCAGGPGTCYYRSIGNTAAYSTGSGACTATNGQTLVSCPGAGWQSANRGRGDRITIDGADYMVRSVDSETQLQLSTPFTGATGVGNKSYVMSRQFATLQAWEDCISTGGGACPYFTVANGNLVTGNRSEIGVAYEDTVFTGGGAVPILDVNGSTTDASHTITLTADGQNRHYGISNTGVVINNGANGTRAIVIQDQFVTVEWMEVQDGGTTGAICIDYVPGNASNHASIRNNLIRNCSSQAIRLAGSASAHVADISNNIVYRAAREAVRVNAALGTGTGSRVNIFNNTFYRNNGATAQPNTEISTAERPNPYVVLRNNIVVDDAQTPDLTWNGSALCTNAANCDWWNAASGHNATGDAAPPTGQWRSDIGPNPRGGGLASTAEASLSFVNTTAGSENLHLLAGSAAWNQGPSLAGVVAGDVDAQVRSGLWDLGADELPPSSAPPLIVLSDTAGGPPRVMRYSTFQGTSWTAPALVGLPAAYFTAQGAGSGQQLFNKVARTHPNGTRRAAVSQENFGGAGGARLHVSLWDGTNWDNGLGAPFSDAQWWSSTVPTPMTFRHFDAAYEQQSGDLVVMTGSNTNRNVHIYTYNGSAWSSNLGGVPINNGTFPDNFEDTVSVFRWVRLEPRPGTNQIALIGAAADGISNDSSAIYAGIWDGSTNQFGSKILLSAPISGPNGSMAQPLVTTDGLDIDFVLGGANAGEALATWGTGTTLWRRIWNPGSGWGANAQLTDLGGTNVVRWIRQKAASNGDDILVAFEDDNERIHTARYDGNSRVFSSFAVQSIAAYGNAASNRPFDVVWDLASGANNVMLVYSDTAGIKYRISADGGASWTGEQTLTIAFQAHWVQAERDPSNVVHVVIKDQADDLRAWSWRAGTWTVTTPVLPSTNVETNGASQNVEAFAIATYPPVVITTAVKLQSFDATGADGVVELAWKTGSELDNQGFHLYRGASADGPWTRLTKSLIPGMGSSPLGRSYSFRDPGLVNGQLYYYRLEDVDTRSKSTFHGPVSAVPQKPAAASPDEPDTRRRSRRARVPRSECPAWVEAEYRASAPSAAPGPIECTKHGDPEAVSLEAVSRSARSALLELRTGGFYAVHEPGGEVRAFIPGFDAPADPSAPALPLRRALVEAVVGRKARLVATAAYDRKTFGGLRPAALGAPEMQVGGDGTVSARRQARRGLRRSAGLLPSEVARLVETVFQGESKSAVVELAPLRYDTRSGRLVLAGRVRFKLDFTARDPEEAGLGSRGRRRPRKPPAEAPASQVIAELHTSRTGVHAVTFEAALPGGGPALDVSGLTLVSRGASVPFHVEPEGRRFGPGSTLYFYAASTAPSTSFSGEVAYQLVRGTSGVRMDERTAAPRGVPLGSAPAALASFEVNRYYQPGLLEAPDPWLWEALPGGAVRVKPFTLSGVDALSPLPAEVVVQLQGATDAIETSEDHHVRVAVNGIELGEAFFDGKRAERLSLPLPASLLRDGTNEIALSNVGDTGVSSMFFLDRFELRHPQAPRLRQGAFDGTWLESGAAEVGEASGPVVALDVTEAESGKVSWLRGAIAAGGALRFEADAQRRYVLASGEGVAAPRVAHPGASTLRDPASQADYLVVAPRAFLSAVEPLVDRRASQGLRSRAVAFEEIASVFGGGQPTAEAIREFLRFAYHSWSRPSPRYVLLVGDASYDPRNFTGTSQAAPLPALFVPTSYLVTASDPALAAVNGEDALPDLAIGRLPAKTPEEAEALVGKLIAFEDSGQGLDGRALLVADNPDAAGDFEADIRDIRDSFMAGRDVELLNLSEHGAATRPKLLDALNGGLAHLAYVGHGGAAVWASENVLNSWDTAALVAQSRQPLVVTMNCLNGYFVAPSFDALGEALVKAEGRGAIAAFSPSGLSLDGPAHVLHRALSAELSRGGHERLGDAVLAAQKAYAEAGPMPELLGIYHLLGDPALVIRR